MDTAKSVMLPLDQPRVIGLTIAGRPVRFSFRRHTQKDWREYFKGIVNQTVQRGEIRENVITSESALADLVTNSLTNVDAYGELKGNWQRLIPMRHRVSAGTVVRMVGPQKSADDFALTETADVYLEAPWTIDEAGSMTLFSGLIHRFRQPGIEELHRYQLETSRVSVTGTAEYGVTTYPSRQLIAMKLYDELIEEVEGYSVGGYALTGKENICREMDGNHKAVAVLELFARSREEVVFGAPQTPVAEPGEEEGE